MNFKRKSGGPDLLKRAIELARAGFSPIPVRGDLSPKEPKRPAISWKSFQRRIAAEDELRAMFQAKAGAVGIVCGRVSKLLVIDFDDLLRYQRFCRHLPQYSETYTVKTRRGFHLYFRTAEKVPSHQFDGGDIKGEKSYVIAPPSRIDGVAYRCVKEARERELENGDVDRLMNYFHLREPAASVGVMQPVGGKDEDFVGLYERLASRIGRNNALYRAASLARASGVLKARVEERLLELHARWGSRPGHKRESLRERALEGLRTIGSVFKKGATRSGMGGGVPNSVRERLLESQGSTVVARLLDALELAGWEAERFFTLGEAIGLGERYGLNRKSVMQALTGERCVYDGRHIVARRYVEYMDSRGFNRGRRGRPVELVFQAPSTGRLLRVLKVALSPSDRLEKCDLRSARAYRLAMHRAYISRLKPRASMGMLARRIGVCVRTLRRYNACLKVAVTAHIGRAALKPDCLSCLPVWDGRKGKQGTAGFWLETAGGLRVPAWRHLGKRLLAGGEVGARICVRLVSGYELMPAARSGVRYEEMSARELAGVIARRCPGRKNGVLRRLGAAVRRDAARASAYGQGRVQLFFENVAARIAEDKVADTIDGCLVAVDAAGVESRRPARRGIAYRMLKEFGDGNVYLALRGGRKDGVLAWARGWLEAWEAAASGGMLAPKMS